MPVVVAVVVVVIVEPQNFLDVNFIMYINSAFVLRFVFFRYYCCFHCCFHCFVVIFVIVVISSTVEVCLLLEVPLFFPLLLFIVSNVVFL